MEGTKVEVKREVEDYTEEEEDDDDDDDDFDPSFSTRNAKSKSKAKSAKKSTVRKPKKLAPRKPKSGQQLSNQDIVEKYGVNEQEIPKDEVDRLKFIARLKRKLSWSQMTPERKEAIRKLERDRKREQRAFLKSEENDQSYSDGSSISAKVKVKKKTSTNAEKIESIRKANVEIQRRRRANMTEEERQMVLKKQLESTRRKRANMTAEEKKIIRERQAEASRLRRANMTDEQKRIARERQAQATRLKRANMTPEEAEKIKESQRQYARRKWDNLTPEDRQKKKERIQFYNLERRATRTLTEEEKRRKQAQNYFSRKAQEARMAPEELEEFLKRRREKSKEYYKSLTGEKLERHKENMKKAARKSAEKNKGKNKEKIRKYYENKRLNQTPEERQKTLLRYRITQAKRLLRRKLEKAGQTPEVIQVEVEKLVERMKAEPLPPLTTEYKPRASISRNSAAASSSSVPPSNAVYKEENYFIEEATIPPNPPSSNVSHSPSTGNWTFLHPHTFAMITPDTMTVSKGEVKMEPFRNYVAPAQSVTSEVSYSTDYSHSQESHSQEPPAEEDSYFDDNFDNDNNDDCDFPSESSPSPPTASQQQPSFLVPSPPSSFKMAVPLPPRFPPPTSPSPSSSSSCSKPNSISKKPPTLWKCPKCKLPLSSMQEFSEHYKTAHKNVEEQVNQKSQEDKNNKSKKPRKQRLTTKKKKTPPKCQSFICMKCPKVTSKSIFQNKDKLLSHVKQKHRKFYHPCPKCKLLKYDAENLKIHVNICEKQ